MKKVIRNGLSLVTPFLLIWHRVKYLYMGESKVIVLIFHEVKPELELKFKKIIAYLHEKYKFISPSQFFNYLEGKSELKGLNILVTFDDGFSSSKRAAEKYLEPLGIRSIFFCCSGFLNKGFDDAKEFVSKNIYLHELDASAVTPQEISMSNNDLSILANKKNVIGSHSRSHAKLSLISDSEKLTDEILGSRKELELIINKDVDSFAYPFGDINSINESALDCIKKSYKYCFTGIRGPVNKSSNPFILSRSSVTLTDNFWLQIALVLGGSDIFHFLKRRKLKGYIVKNLKAIHP